MCEKEDEENDEERRKESSVKVAYIYRECIRDVEGNLSLAIGPKGF